MVTELRTLEMSEFAAMPRKKIIGLFQGCRCVTENDRYAIVNKEDQPCNYHAYKTENEAWESAVLAPPEDYTWLKIMDEVSKHFVFIVGDNFDQVMGVANRVKNQNEKIPLVIGKPSETLKTMVLAAKLYLDQFKHSTL